MEEKQAKAGSLFRIAQMIGAGPLKTMTRHKGGSSHNPGFPGSDVQWENRFDGFATEKPVCDSRVEPRAK
jgi:hypothetical protein